MSSLQALTASICEPKTDIRTMPGGGFRTTLNQYLISVCDPGGGKSNTFYRILQQVLDLQDYICRSFTLSTLSTLSICQPCRPCQPVESVNLSTLSTCRPCQRVDPVKHVNLSTLSISLLYLILFKLSTFMEKVQEYEIRWGKNIRT